MRKSVRDFKHPTHGEVRKENTMEVWGKMLNKNPTLKTTIYVALAHLLLVLFTSYQRNMFLDQYLGLSIVGNIFIWMHMNIIFSFKLLIGKHPRLQLGIC